MRKMWGSVPCQLVQCGVTLARPGGGGTSGGSLRSPVRLSPATHSQGHGRPCLQRPHPPHRSFSATWSFSYGNMLVPGLIKFRGVSGYPRWAEESPLRQLPAGPSGDNRAFPHHRLSSLPLFHYARLTSLPLGLSMMYIPAA